MYIGNRPKDSSILKTLLSKKPKAAVEHDKLLVFDSDFEGGNLDFVQKKDSETYSLWMRCDTNSKYT